MADDPIQYGAHDVVRSSGADDRQAMREAARAEMRNPGAEGRQQAAEARFDHDNIVSINNRLRAAEAQLAKVMTANGIGVKVDWPAINIDLRALRGGNEGDGSSGQTLDFEFGVGSGDFVVYRIPATQISTA